MDDVQRLDSINKQLNELRSKAAVAGADVARITADITDMLKELKEKYGCATYEDAVSLLADLKDELADEFDVVERQLDAIRGK